MQQPFLVVIDGIIASGKSTLIKKVVPLLSETYTVGIIKEPVDQWIESGILSKFYQDRSRWGYTFQTTAFKDRIGVIEDALKHPSEVYVSERYLNSDKIFMKLLHEDKSVSDMEMTMYNSWCDMWSKMVPLTPSLVVYIRPDLDVCMDRYKMRSREGEVLDVEYQRQLLAKYDELYGYSVGCNAYIKTVNKTIVLTVTDVDINVTSLVSSIRSIKGN